MELRHMSEMDLEKLKQLVLEACDSLYNQRQLITKRAILNKLAVNNEYTAQELEHWVPQYINTWRLANIETADSVHLDKIIELEAQILKYQTNLQYAELEISKLRTELLNQKEIVRIQRAKIIQGLRDMLGQGRI